MQRFGKAGTSLPCGSKRVEGFQTGDHVRAIIPKGKYKGTHIGRVTIRASGYFDIKTKSGQIGSSWKYCQLLQRDDGYEYSVRPVPLKPSKAGDKGTEGN